ncbi:hypothetical protein [Bacillus subtilis]|uniref:hypothetical protein n=1 Tax=Bacillus subtilis TaxID=1423 RepID=UPI002E21B2EB|nr:hypothetical protein [Bacillus subtilis]
MVAEQALIAGGLVTPARLPLYRMKARLAFGYFSHDMLEKQIHMRNKKRGKERRASSFVFRKACMRDSQSMDVNVPSFAERNLIN